ncbi:hypothetical protein SAMN05444161_4144 [Rhizobiales bacterium GAS191]|jgi:hypothetical protein|nr:hypothetical protein SAMN05519103_03444 [Rhizobiales bacterium GAS113]SED83501.1 hypothetical protein SAMN05444161_4144 [Rhizobiales bacterium GAS191]
MRGAELDGVLQSIDRAAELVAQWLDCPLEPKNSSCPDYPCSTRSEESAILALTWSVRECESGSRGGLAFRKK